MNLTAHFSLAELTASSYAARNGLNNMPTDPDILANIELLAQGLERVRSIVDKPIIVTSGYRSPKVNTGIGGSRTSAHMKGLAADIKVHGYSPLALAKIIESEKDYIRYQQLLNEFDQWVHIAFPDVDEPPRMQTLTAKRENGEVVYLKGLV